MMLLRVISSVEIQLYTDF